MKKALVVALSQPQEKPFMWPIGNGQVSLMNKVSLLVASYSGTADFKFKRDFQGRRVVCPYIDFPDSVSEEKQAECALKVEELITAHGGEVV